MGTAHQPIPFKRGERSRRLRVALAVLSLSWGCASTQSTFTARRIQDPPQLSPYARPLFQPQQPAVPYETQRLQAPTPANQPTPERAPVTVPPRTREPSVPSESSTPEPGATPPANLQPDGPSLEAPAPFGGESAPAVPGVRETPPDATVDRGDTVTLSASAPREARVGETINFRVAVLNQADKAVENVTVLCTLPDGLVFPGAPQRAFRQRVGRLEPGQERVLDLGLSCDRAGRMCVEFLLTADGIADTTESVCVVCRDESVNLEIIGPEERTAGDRAEYVLVVANLSGVDQPEVQVVLTHDGVLEPREASAGARTRPGLLAWDLGLLRADERVQIQVEFACASVAEQTSLVAMLNGRQIPSRAVESRLRVAPVGDIKVTVRDDNDPAAVGSRINYIVRVTNHRLKPVSQLQLMLNARGLQPVGVTVNGVDRIKSSRFDPATGAFHVPLTTRLGAEETDEVIVEMIATHAGAGELKATVTRESDGTHIVVTEPTIINAPSGSIAWDLQ